MASGNYVALENFIKQGFYKYTITLTLTDEEFMDFLSKINQIALKYMNAEVTENSKIRQVTLISSPTEEQVK